MERHRILIITNGQLSRNPRPLKEARTLGEAGQDVSVLMVRNHPDGERFDAEIMRDAPFRRECVDLLAGFADSTATVRLRRARVALARRWFPSTIASLGPANTLLARARALPADLTIVHNEVPHWVGRRLAASGRRVAADIEDWHSEDLLPSDRARRPLELLRKTERALLHDTVYASTTSHALADALHERYGGRRPDVISNSFPLQPAPGREMNARPPAFVWFSQTLGPGRGLEKFIDAWCAMRVPTRLELLGEARDDFKAALLASIAPSRQGDVAFRDPVSPAALPAFLARHDVGLALEDRSIPSRDLTITNKILQYLNAGLSVVATATTGQREVLSRAPAAGLLLPEGEPRIVARALDEFVANPAALAESQRAARRLAEEVYCWENEAPRLLARVEQAVMRP